MRMELGCPCPSWLPGRSRVHHGQVCVPDRSPRGRGFGSLQLRVRNWLLIQLSAHLELETEVTVAATGRGRSPRCGCGVLVPLPAARRAPCWSSLALGRSVGRGVVFSSRQVRKDESLPSRKVPSASVARSREARQALVWGPGSEPRLWPAPITHHSAGGSRSHRTAGWLPRDAEAPGAAGQWLSAKKTGSSGLGWAS